MWGAFYSALTSRGKYFLGFACRWIANICSSSPAHSLPQLCTGTALREHFQTFPSSSDVPDSNVYACTKSLAHGLGIRKHGLCHSIADGPRQALPHFVSLFLWLFFEANYTSCLFSSLVSTIFCQQFI